MGPVRKYTNSCFEKFVSFKRIMSDGLDRKVALKKNSVLFPILSKLLEIMYFFLVSSNHRNTGITLNFLTRQKILLWKR